MSNITSLMSIALGAILVNNFIFSQFLGCCPFLGVSKKLDTAVGMGVAVTFVMGLASAITWIVNEYILVKFDLLYMQTVVFILVIAALVQFIEMFLQKSMPSLYTALGIYLPLITTNCAVLGVALLNIQSNFNFIESVVYGITGGLGFLLAIVLFASVRERNVFADCPKCFEGFPIALVTAGLMALSFMLKDDTFYTIAKIACFRDSIASSGDLEGMGLKNTGGYVFYDGNNDRWMDPGKPAARQYLIDLATGCAVAGFNEILLTDVSYPTVGKLNKIDYGAAATGQPDSLKEELDAFLTQMKTALAKYNVKLSVLLPSDLIASNNNANGASGQSLVGIAPLVDRVYAPTEGTYETLSQVEANLAAVSKTTEFVSVLHAAENIPKGSYLITP